MTSDKIALPLLGHFHDDRDAVVGRGVVQHDDFLDRMGLIEDRVEALGETMRIIVVRYHHRNRRHSLGSGEPQQVIRHSSGTESFPRSAPPSACARTAERSGSARSSPIARAIAAASQYGTTWPSRSRCRATRECRPSRQRQPPARPRSRASSATVGNGSSREVSAIRPRRRVERLHIAAEADQVEACRLPRPARPRAASHSSSRDRCRRPSRSEPPNRRCGPDATPAGTDRTPCADRHSRRRAHRRVGRTSPNSLAGGRRFRRRLGNLLVAALRTNQKRSSALSS